MNPAISREMVLLSELLEKCYIHSTDIEYSQFYMKELALRAEQASLEFRRDNKHLMADIKKQSEQLFEGLEMKKSQYFKENIKEMSGSEKVLQSLNLEMKERKDALLGENYRLKEKMELLEEEVERVGLKLGQQALKENVCEQNYLDKLEHLKTENQKVVRRVKEFQEKGTVIQKRLVGLESENELLKMKVRELKGEREKSILEVKDWL